MSPFDIYGPGPTPFAMDEFSSPALSTGGGGGGLEAFGDVTTVAGAVTAAIGTFFQLQARQYELKSQALALEYEADIANINARIAEADAHNVLEAGRRRQLLTTLRYGQAKARERVSQGARGLQAGSGSTAEAQVSLSFAKDLDRYTIDADSHRAAGAIRRRALDERSRAEFAGVSAETSRASANTIFPALGAGTSLLGSAGRVASQFAKNKREERLFGRS